MAPCKAFYKTLRIAYLANVVRAAARSRDRIRECSLVAVTLLALVCGPDAAEAEQPSARRAKAFRLVWSSSASCEARSFLEELSDRTTLLREARADEHAITLIVETFRAPSGVRGKLSVRKPDGELTVREVPGASCREVDSAMALIAALMVDPLAAGLERASSQRHAASTAPEPNSTAREANLGFRIEQRLTGQTAVAPRFTWGQAVGVMLTHETSRFRPSLGLSARVARDTTSVAQGSAELDFAAAQLTLCPLGVRPDASWDLRACAAVQLGRLRGTGFDTPAAATKSVLWSSAGVELQARYQLLGPLWMGAEGTLGFPFSRESFHFEPQKILHRIPAWGASAALGVGLRFL